jgi:hypothetical protein
MINHRNEVEFHKISAEIKSKYQEENERVRKWLKETGQV